MGNGWIRILDCAASNLASKTAQERGQDRRRVFSHLNEWPIVPSGFPRSEAEPKDAYDRTLGSNSIGLSRRDKHRFCQVLTLVVGHDHDHVRTRGPGVAGHQREQKNREGQFHRVFKPVSPKQPSGEKLSYPNHVTVCSLG